MKFVQKAILVALLSFPSWANAEVAGTAFTYQGRLTQLGVLANGTFDLEFAIFNVSAAGSPVASTLVKENVPVSEGIFTAQLDFGREPFDGQKLWLEIGVREGSSAGEFTRLVPRQELTPTPYAIAASQDNTSSVVGELLPRGGICPYGFVMRGVSATGAPVCLQVQAAALGNVFEWPLDSAPTISTVDSNGMVGMYAAIAIGTDGFPVITYRNAGTGVMVAKCNDLACSGTDETVTNVHNVASTYQMAIAVGPDGFPVIAYIEDLDDALVVTHCNDSACTGMDETTTVVDSLGNTGWFPSIAVGADGLPIISYQRTDSQLLRVAKCDDGACSGGGEQLTTLVDQQSSGWWLFAPLVIGADGLPVLSYFDIAGQDLKVIKCNDSACQGGDELISTVATSGVVGQWSSMAIGSDGFPVILYLDSANSPSDVTGTLWFVKCNDLACAGGDESFAEILAADAQISLNVAIGVDGFPVLSYFENDNLIVEKCHTMTCQASRTKSLVVSVGPITVEWLHFASMTIGIDGFPIIAYFDQVDHYLKVAKCHNLACSP